LRAARGVQCAAAMHVHTADSRAVNDAIDDFLAAVMPLYRFWCRRADVNACAVDVVFDGAMLLAKLLVEHGRGHEYAVAIAQQLYVHILALLRLLEAETRAPPRAVIDARNGCVQLLELPAEHGYGTCRADGVALG
jgi:hypothetical protein